MTLPLWIVAGAAAIIVFFVGWVVGMLTVFFFD